MGISGRLDLSLDGSPSPRPMDVSITTMLDLDALMAEGKLTMDPDDPSKVRISLEGVTLGFTLDAHEVLSRGANAIVEWAEESAT